MGSPDLDKLNSLQLSQLTSFNREVAALVRAGLPLELGLGAGRVDSLSDRIGEHLRNGLTLSEALDRQSSSVPPTYRALIEAGGQADNLPRGLEAVARIARTMALLRRRMRLAMIYPSLLILATAVATIAVINWLAKEIAVQFVAIGEAPPPVIDFLLWLTGENPAGWLYWAPALLVLMLWVGGGTRFLTLRMPGIGRTLRYLRLAVFAELAAALVEFRMPLEQAVPLAATASGDRRLRQQAEEFARKIEGGQEMGAALGALRSLPAFARWMITAGSSQNALPATLNHLARWAREHGERNAQRLAIIGPVALTLVLGGTTLAIFATLSFAPVISLLQNLAEPVSM